MQDDLDGPFLSANKTISWVRFEMTIQFYDSTNMVVVLEIKKSFPGRAEEEERSFWKTQYSKTSYGTFCSVQSFR